MFIGCLAIVGLLMFFGCDTTEPENEAPVIASLTAHPDTIEVSGTSTLTCVASDPDGDDLSYTWEIAAGSISGSGLIVTWTAPGLEGIYSVSCRVDDGNGGQDIEIANIVVMSNEAPVILSLTADPPIVEVGGNSTLTCVASDPDNDVLTYTWESVEGSISGSGSSVVWTAPNSEGTYTVSCKVEDRYSWRDIDSVTIEVITTIARWTFDEMTGDTLHDVSGNGNHGVIHGATWTTGVSGGALSFDGNDYVKIPYSPSLNIGSASSSFTVEVWAKISIQTAHGAQGIIGKDDRVHSPRIMTFDIGLGSGNWVYFQVLSGSNWDSYQSWSTLTINDGIWHHYAMVRDIASGVFKCYANGDSIGIINDNFGDLTSTEDIMIGASFADDGSPTLHLHGVVDEVRIYNAALNPDDFLDF